MFISVSRQVRSPGAAYDPGDQIVWCSKYRRPVLGGSVGARLEELIRQRAAEHDWQIIALEVVPDQVHLFVKPHPKDSLSFVANQFKGMTSRVLRVEFLHLKSRLVTLWSRSFFVATVGAVSAVMVQRYIDTQYERVPRRGGI